MLAHNRVGFYILRIATGLKSSIEDIRHWCEISNFIGSSQSVIDRSGKLIGPICMTPSDSCKLDFEQKFGMTYEEVCNFRGRQILDIQEKIDKPIALMYSGGIDSSLVVITMLKLLGPEKFKKRITVYLTQESINEHPSLYYNYLRKYANLESATQFKSLLDKNRIMVGAEFNDQLFGSLLLKQIVNEYGEDIIHKKFDFGFLTDLMSKSKMSSLATERWISFLKKGLHGQDFSSVNTVFDFFWWFNFIFKWQSVYYRIPLRALPAHQQNMTKEFLDTYYHHFFNSKEFQSWSISNPDKRIKKTWSSYKWPAKELIFQFTKDSEYRDHKLKLGSLYNLFKQSFNPVAMTSDYKFHHDIDLDPYYISKSDF